MTKLLVVVLVTVLLVFWLKRLANRGGARRDRPARTAEDMVRCRHCGVNLPRSEAVMSQGRFYCSDEHRRRGQ